MTTGGADDIDDPLLSLRLHESTVRMLSILLRALVELCEVEDDRLPKELRSCLAQALDTAADLEILFGVLAETLEQARRNAIDR